jgi:hypothetical protein
VTNVLNVTCDKWQALRRKQPELLERGAILLQDNATTHRHRDVQNLVQRWG